MAVPAMAHTDDKPAPRAKPTEQTNQYRIK
jgi:hypothetical protein